MSQWAIVLFCNEPYINKTMQTIYEIRTIGQWGDDIILMIQNEDCNKNLTEFITKYDVKIFNLPYKDVSPILQSWDMNKSHPNYEYIMSRTFMYMKFYVFSIYFRKWDTIFYMDAGISIHGPLSRMKNTCQPTHCIYAHSDAYPFFEWKLRGQFTLGDPERIEKEYDLDIDYFQGTMFIYDTRIIEDDTVDGLFDLAFMYHFSTRMDQGILNLYFNCKKKLWKQIPVKDHEGFLYDFLRRSNSEYLLLKMQ